MTGNSYFLFPLREQSISSWKISFVCHSTRWQKKICAVDSFYRFLNISYTTQCWAGLRISHVVFVGSQSISAIYSHYQAVKQLCKPNLANNFFQHACIAAHKLFVGLLGKWKMYVIKYQGCTFKKFAKLLVDCNCV